MDIAYTDKGIYSCIGKKSLLSKEKKFFLFLSQIKIIAPQKNVIFGKI